MTMTHETAVDPAVDAGADPVRELFASSSVTEHVLRGMIGLVLAVGALALASHTAWALVGLLLAALAWRGCPTCWALGLAPTVSRDRGRGTVRRDCPGGTCR